MKKIVCSNLFFLFILTIIVFAVYGKAINFGYTNLDDDELVYKNIDYISHLKNIQNFFKTDCYYGHDTQYYRPVLTLSFVPEAIAFGANPKFYHFADKLLFIIALFLIYFLLSKLNINETILKLMILLFGVHPVLSSVPAWIPSRNDTLLTIFFILSLINFISYLKTNKKIFLLVHLIFFTFSLFTKETTILLFLMYPLLIYCFDLKISKKQIINNIILILPIFIIYFFLRYFAVRSLNISFFINLCQYITKNIIVGIMIYIEKIFYPTSMPIMLYDIFPTIKTCIVNVIVFSLLIYIYYKKIINRKIIVFSLLFSFLSILPTFILEDYALFTHRLMTSLVGIIILLSLIFEKIILKFPRIKKYLVVIYIFIFTLFSFCSFMQIDKYKNSNVYWLYAYKDASNYHAVCNGLAKQCLINGDYDKAIELFYKAKKLKNLYEYDLNICSALIAKGELDKAKNRLLNMTKLKDDFTTFRYLSEIYRVQGDIENSNLWTEKLKKIFKQK